ncbi:hypothetical protein DXG01_005916 [Tephrocybe rancida]|nr:hypothetical protein DXG01_005916 [Tephrocybe rancida]
MGRKRAAPPTHSKRSVANLEAARTAVRDEFARPDNTRNKYNNYIKRGKEFLQNLAQQRREDAVEDDLNTDVLALAFDEPPNKHSAVAVEYFLSQECCEDGKGKDTAAGIQGAFCDYWDNMGDGRYSGNFYQYHEESDTVYGCPARAPAFRSLIHAINKRSKTTGTRNHAEAIDIESMMQTIDWSEGQYPSEKLKHLPENRRVGALALKHAEARSMFTLAFILWTRQAAALLLVSIRLIPTQVLGTDIASKGWQNKTGLEAEGMDYELHPRPDISQIDTQKYLDIWLRYRELITGKPLGPDEFLFPYISANGIPHLDRFIDFEFQVDTLAKYLLNCQQKREKSYSHQLLVGAPSATLQPEHAAAGPATVDDIHALGFMLSATLAAAMKSSPTAASTPPQPSAPSYPSPFALLSWTFANSTAPIPPSLSYFCPFGPAHKRVSAHAAI